MDQLNRLCHNGVGEIFMRAVGLVYTPLPRGHSSVLDVRV